MVTCAINLINLSADTIHTPFRGTKVTSVFLKRNASSIIIALLYDATYNVNVVKSTEDFSLSRSVNDKTMAVIELWITVLQLNERDVIINP